MLTNQKQSAIIVLERNERNVQNEKGSCGFNLHIEHGALGLVCIIFL